MRTSLFATAFCLGSLACAADRYPVDWPKIESETLDFYTSVIKIDTSNPPGDETKVVDYLKPILDRAGIPTEVLSLDPKRANLIARIKAMAPSGLSSSWATPTWSASSARPGRKASTRSPPSAKTALCGDAVRLTTSRT